jgi:hypothetical protein
MLRSLLEGRIVFTPRPELPAVDFTGRGDYGRLFAGLIVPRALASPMLASWNQIATWLRTVDELRRVA